MASGQKACKACKLIISHGDTCPICGSTDMTQKWSGSAMILNAEKSEVAKKLGVKMNSTFALSIKE